MPLDADAVRRGCRGAEVTTAQHLCRAEIERFRAIAATASRSSSAAPRKRRCSPKSPERRAATLTFVNVRETAGWSDRRRKAGPKMAALIAAAAEPMPDVPFVSLTSEGVTLVYGRDERAIEAAKLLAEHLDVTVLITPPEGSAPPRVTEFPVVKGTIRSAKGHLGAFEMTVDDYAAAAALVARRADLRRRRATARCRAATSCSISPAARRCFPRTICATAICAPIRAIPPPCCAPCSRRAISSAGFDKPRYIKFTEDLCAHSRSKIVGCHRCLDLCPTGAIAPAGDHVAIDANICAGCGQCAAVCPTGAAAYALPPADALLRKLRALLTTYREAGGAQPGRAAARRAARRRADRRARAPRRRIAGERAAARGQRGDAGRARSGRRGVRLWRVRGCASCCAPSRATTSPACARRSRWPSRSSPVSVSAPAASPPSRPTIRSRSARRCARSRLPTARRGRRRFTPVGAKRDVLRLALRELHHAAPAPVDIVALPAGAPFGTVELNVEGCTLCLSCVSACPTGALSDDQERPMLRFAEDACVQCGLCKATCPEKVITLKPQLDFRAATAPARVLKEEEPFCCIRCGKPFGVKSTIERVAAKLEGKHWMFQNSAKRLDVIKMCADCRVIAMTEENFDPYGAPRGRVRAPRRIICASARNASETSLSRDATLRRHSTLSNAANE